MRPASQPFAQLPRRLASLRPFFRVQVGQPLLLWGLRVWLDFEIPPYHFVKSSEVKVNQSPPTARPLMKLPQFAFLGRFANAIRKAKFGPPKSAVRSKTVPQSQ